MPESFGFRTGIRFTHGRRSGPWHPRCEESGYSLGWLTDGQRGRALALDFVRRLGREAHYLVGGLGAVAPGARVSGHHGRWEPSLW